MLSLVKFILLLVTLVITSEAKDEIMIRKTTVVIQAEIPGEGVTMHCYSKDNELGTHVLYYGQQFTIRFHVNIWNTTQFMCHFYTKYGSGSYAVYDWRVAGENCPGYCHWFIRKNGPCLQQTVDPNNGKFWCQAWKNP